MPFFRPVESAARNLRPLSDHRLIVSPLLAPPVEALSTRRSRVAGRSQALLGGVAVLAVAGALSAGVGSSGHAGAAIPATSFSAAADAPGVAALLSPAAYSAPAVAAAPAAAPAVAKPAAKVTAATAKAHVPARQTDAHAPHGASVVSHQDTVNVKAMTSALRKLRTCETGGNYREASGNGYYGAYQFDLSTWRSLGLSGYPSNASQQLQDVAVVRLEMARGWGPWPVCSYVAGLR